MFALSPRLVIPLILAHLAASYTIPPLVQATRRPHSKFSVLAIALNDLESCLTIPVQIPFLSRLQHRIGT